MRPQKLTPEHMLNLCALQFKAHGYAGTSMDMLAKACGLSKASFYYYYPNKEALLLKVLEHTHLYLKQYLFASAYAEDINPVIEFNQMHERALQFFSYEIKGCLVGILSIESGNISEQIVQKIREIFQDWQQAFYQLFRHRLDENSAQTLAKISIADYEGAILMYRLNHDIFYLDQIKTRILQALQS
ncbi:TetR/AcrR family transcriptional regulator [Acinetobacter piscicola]|uniref:TetR/AcrR family transcriptional regulator n=1 Tax=Acinetobacter piscicola TaxID=2006115 RepID=UPI000B7D2872|nr:TetR/AcrR family transcriptional regulator [Acinetobacter piscicola]